MLDGLVLFTKKLKTPHFNQLNNTKKVRSRPAAWKFALLDKLDGVAPLITDPPPTSFTTLSEKNNK